MRGATDNNSFGLVLTAINEVHKPVYYTLNLRELHITVFIQLIVYAFIVENITVSGSPQVFDGRILYQVFLPDAFHFCVRKRRRKFILHQILDIYLNSTLIIAGLSIVQKLFRNCICGVTR